MGHDSMIHPPLSLIDTVVIVIMENRSFDHTLGYLSLDGPSQIAVEGFRSAPGWQSARANQFNGATYSLHRVGADYQISDPQHNRVSIRTQIELPPADHHLSRMGGFVESYAKFSDRRPADLSAVMGYYDANSVPVFDFFARNYCVCDHWFASLPLGTQANRLMAMAGESLVIDNAPAGLPFQKLVYDWLRDNDISWSAYQSGGFLPFFSLMPHWFLEIVVSLTSSQQGGPGHFRRYNRFRAEWVANAPAPSVIFIEPEYTDGPHSAPNDDHPPTGIAPGQEFLANIYNTLISNPQKWVKTMLVVTYDEHGGFFDHVPPLPIETTVSGQKFTNTGVRVPAFVISPYARRGVFSGHLDHTSLLQLLDDRFGSGPGYSNAVNQRQKNFDRLLNTLVDVAGPTPALQFPAAAELLVTARAIVPPVAPNAPATPNAQALHGAARKLANDYPDYLRQPGWEQVQAYLAAYPVGPMKLIS
jgi:phospholipase C